METTTVSEQKLDDKQQHEEEVSSSDCGETVACSLSNQQDTLVAAHDDHEDKCVNYFAIIATVSRYAFIAALITAVILIFTQNYHIKILEFLHKLQQSESRATVIMTLLIYALTFVIIAIVGVPCSVMSVAAGMLYRPYIYAFGVVCACIILSSVVGFYIGRLVIKRLIFGKQQSLVNGQSNHFSGEFYKSAWFKRRRKIRTMLYAMKLNQRDNHLDETSIDNLLKNKSILEFLLDFAHYLGFRWHVFKMATLFRFIQVLPFAVTTYALAVMTPNRGPNALKVIPFVCTTLLGVMPGLSVFIWAGSLVDDYNNPDNESLEERMGHKAFVVLMLVSSCIVVGAFALLICWGRKTWRGMVKQVEYEVRLSRSQRRLKMENNNRLIPNDQQSIHSQNEPCDDDENEDMVDTEDDLSFISDGEPIQDCERVPDHALHHSHSDLTFQQLDQSTDQDPLLAADAKLEDTKYRKPVLIKPSHQEIRGSLTVKEVWFLRIIFVACIVTLSVGLPLAFTGRI
ncbi:hypothetical protein MP228_009140 [Amoeboaphelidium protococcarum]|nr:hypothetical protein MP228_009140 [Amoeboaphelidium protococcarum]